METCIFDLFVRYVFLRFIKYICLHIFINIHRVVRTSLGRHKKKVLYLVGESIICKETNDGQRDKFYVRVTDRTSFSDCS